MTGGDDDSEEMGANEGAKKQLSIDKESDSSPPNPYQNNQF